MVPLPDPTPISPDLRSPGRFLLRLARYQWRTLVGGVALGSIWMLGHALVPWLIGRTIDDGVVGGDLAATARWCAVIGVVAVVTAITSAMRHRFAVQNWLLATLRCDQLLGYHAADCGVALSSRTATGEVVTAADHDADRVGDLLDITSRFSGAVASFIAVSALLLTLDPLLGVIVLIGVPALLASLGGIVPQLQRRQSAHRDTEGELTELGADTVAGLRVLRGIGGEAEFTRRYCERSQAVRAAGTRVAMYQATLDTAQVLLPGVFLVALTWLAALAALDGRISAGDVVTLYGYGAFLTLPLSVAAEAVNKGVRGWVSAGRLIELLRLTPAHRAPTPPGGATARLTGAPAASDDPALLVDPSSGVRLLAGQLTAIVADRPQDAVQLADRLVRLGDDAPADSPTDPPADPPGDSPPEAALDGQDLPSPLLAGRPINRLPIDGLRARVVLSEAEPQLFTGTLRTQVDPTGARTDAEVLAALQAAAAQDVLESGSDGLDSVVTERGRSLSGGQRQRLSLARALLRDPEVLLLVEPTSAVDAHTEARIARQLRAVRAASPAGQAGSGQAGAVRPSATAVFTASPLLLEQADRVLFLRGGRVVAQGRHDDLLSAEPDYRATVFRGEEP